MLLLTGLHGSSKRGCEHRRNGKRIHNDVALDKFIAVLCKPDLVLVTARAKQYRRAGQVGLYNKKAGLNRDDVPRDIRYQGAAQDMPVRMWIDLVRHTQAGNSIGEPRLVVTMHKSTRQPALFVFSRDHDVT